MKKQLLIIGVISGLSYASHRERTDPSFSSCIGWKHSLLQASLNPSAIDKEVLRQIKSNYQRDDCQKVTGKSIDAIMKLSK